MFYQSQSAIKPAELDTTSSKVYVYQRKNFVKNTMQNFDGTTSDFWTYDERKLTREQFHQLKILELESENTQLQLALTELYEALI